MPLRFQSVRPIDQRNVRDRGLGYTGKAEVLFKWSVVCGGLDEEDDVTVRAEDAVNRGVPTPEAWPTALKCFDLRRLESRAFETYSPPANLRELHDLRCACLGAAKPVAINDDGRVAPRSCVALANEIGARTNYVLVAYEGGNVWLCHPGMFTGDVPDANAPIFHEGCLVRKNVRTDAWGEERRVKRTRIAMHPKAQQVLNQAIEHSDHFAYLVAWAAWC